MDRLIVTLDCECEGSGFILLSVTKDPNEFFGWMVNGSTISLLTVSKDFVEGTDYFTTLGAVLQEKDCYFSRASTANKSVSICKRVDDIVIKILDLNVSEITSGISQASVHTARSLESHLAAAQAQLASQEAELSDLRDRCRQLLDKYAAAAEEKAALRDSLLAAFCRVLNAKKARIAELEGGRQGTTEADGGSDVDGAGGSEKSLEQTAPLPVKPAGRGRGGKRASPAASASAPAKPAMRRTRSGAGKKPRSSGDDDGEEAA